MQTNSNRLYRRVFYLMLFGLVFSLGATAADAAAKQHLGNARVVVKEKGRYKHLPTAMVTLSGPQGKFTARVDRNGVAHFKNIPQSTYRCKITAPGYNKSSTSISLNTTGTIEYSFMLSKAAPAISGLNVTVVDAMTRRPIPDARILASWVTKGNVYKRRKKRSKTITTSAGGAANLPIGHKSLVTSIYTSASGYHPVTLKAVKVPGKLQVALMPRAATKKATTGGQKKISANLAVTVFDQRTKRPLSGAIVAMVINGRTYKMPTRPNGIAYFRGLPVGKYNWTASKPGYKNIKKGLNINEAGTIHQKARLARAY